MRPTDVIPGPRDPNQEPSTPEPLTQPEPQHSPPGTPQEVPGEQKPYPIHREVPTQPIHEGGIT